MRILLRELIKAKRFFILFQAIILLRLFFEISIIGIYILAVTQTGWDGKYIFLLAVCILGISQDLIWFRLFSLARTRAFNDFISSANKTIVLSIAIDFFSFFTGSYRPTNNFDWTQLQNSDIALISLYAKYQNELFSLADLISPTPHGLAAMTCLSFLWIFSKRHFEKDDR